MAVNLNPAADLLPVLGVELASGAAGIRYRNRNDLLLIRLAENSSVAAAFTRNAFCAAPVTLSRRNLAASTGIRAVLINAGNANAGTGQAGMSAAMETCAIAGEVLGCAPEAVLPMSTGVIGQRMPVEPFQKTIPLLAAALDPNGWEVASRTIMTTDTLPKGYSRQIELDGRTITVTGIAKGAGMIRPDMATMLSFVATDAAVEQAALDALLVDAVAGSFNAITVDGDTSTNDTVVLAATGVAGNAPIQVGDAEYAQLAEAVAQVCLSLAQACVRDAEGATRFIKVQVEAAGTLAEARKAAYAVAESPLVKTAAFAGDPNWGRILAAVGRSGVADLDVSGIDLYLDDVCLLNGGEPAADYTEERGASVAKQAEFTIRIVLNRGEVATAVWTCDYSYDYVKINAEYRS